MLPHPIVRVTACQQVAPFTLRLEFDDGATQTIDFSVLYGRLFGPLSDPDFFSRVKIDSECHTLVWPNDADFDPATLRHWPEYLPYLLEMVERWKKSPSTVEA
jgi:hypothetical protein